MKKIETIDMERLALAIAGYNEAIKERETHNATIEALMERCSQLDDAIFEIESALSNKATMSNLSIDAIKDYADNQLRLKNQIVALANVRTGIEREIKEMEGNKRGIQYTETDSKKFIWRVVYEGLLTSFNTDPLIQLVTAGCLLGKDELTVFKELSQSFPETQTEQINAMVKQFGLPV